MDKKTKVEKLDYDEPLTTYFHGKRIPIFHEFEKINYSLNYFIIDLFLFLTEEAYSHGGLQTGKLGQNFIIGIVSILILRM